MKKLGKTALILPFMLWLVLLIIVPLLLIAFYAFTESDGNVLRFTFSHFSKFLKPEYLTGYDETSCPVPTVKGAGDEKMKYETMQEIGRSWGSIMNDSDAIP